MKFGFVLKDVKKLVLNVVIQAIAISWMRLTEPQQLRCALMEKHSKRALNVHELVMVCSSAGFFIPMSLSVVQPWSKKQLEQSIDLDLPEM